MLCTSFKKHFRQFSGFVLLICAFSNGSFTHAQKRRIEQPPVKQKVSARQTTNCGGWSGFITFEKTLNETTNTREQNRTYGTTEIRNSRDYKYTGSIIVDGSQNPNRPQTSAQVSFTDDDKNFKRFEQNDTCFYDGRGSRLQWGETTDNRLTKAFGEGEADSFDLSINPYDGTYRFSVKLPKANGTFNEEGKIRRGGWCQPGNNQPEDNNSTSPVKIDGEAAVIEDQKIDPKNPDVLAGSKTWDTSTATLKSFIYTVTWRFRRCPAPLELEAVEFDEHPYPRWDRWRKVDGETIDGNIVRVRARVTNYSNETKFPKLRFLEQRANVELPDSETNISIAPGESREVSYLWDTSGWSWEIGGFPASQREVKVELTEPTAPTKNLSGEVLIIPRPVILVHGLWADYTAWDGYDRNFKKAHSTSWKSYAVGADPENGLMKTGEKGTWRPSNTIEQNAVELQKQIEAVRHNNNAWHVDAVAHSMGGIIARHYIHFFMDIVADGKPGLTRLVQLGTPNMGSPCAYLMGFTFWMLRNPVTSLEQLRPDFMVRFNRAVRNRKGTRFSVLVGNPVPQTCQSNIWGDGVVEMPSAIWEINDFRYARSLHTDLTSEANFDYFVWRRLSVSWRGNQNPDNNYRTTNEDFEERNQFVNAAFNNSATAEDQPSLPENLKLDLAREVILQSKQVTELEIPVKADANSGITYMAPPTVSATLINEQGAVVGKNSAGTAEAKSDFRSLPIDKPAADGGWKLRLENTAATETKAIVAVWTDTTANRVRLSVEAGKPTANGQIPLTAKLTRDGSPVSGTTVKAKILAEDGKILDLTLLDDGKNGDGSANDGTYGALTVKLAKGDYSIEATAEFEGKLPFAATGLTIGAVNKPAALTKPKTK